MSIRLNTPKNYSDVILIGGGIMSATIGILLKQLEPDLRITIYERLDKVANESSNAWNNAGTGHSALCELNYTPENENGEIEVNKALKIFESFQESKQFWSYLVEKNIIDKPEEFIRPIPHMSFVFGEENVNYLKKRHEKLSTHLGFSEMKFTDNPEEIRRLVPLMMHNRDEAEKVAATIIENGTDVNFGKLTEKIFEHLISLPNVKMRLHHEVQDISQLNDGHWELTLDNLASKKRHKKKAYAGFVFVGAGGGALNILEKSDIHESKGYGGFPVSGQWLRCTNPEIVAQHHAKVYGKAAIGAPPMSVPHLDSRIIDGKRELLFGPFAGFTTRFLKEGSLMDLPNSLSFDNIIPILQVGLHNMDLTKYLIEQVIQSPEDRIAALKEYYPDANLEDWELLLAGQRVQVIKNDTEKGGILEFGTEMVASKDGSIATLLGASPGASTAVSIMLKLLEKCFPNQFSSAEWQAKLQEIFPAFGKTLSQNPELYQEICEKTNHHLSLESEQLV